MIEPIEGKGVNRARVICDDCGREEVVACDYIRRADHVWLPNEGRVKKKIVGQGWADVKRKLFCPACESKRKVVKMEDVKAKQAEAPREPTKVEKRQIMDMLAEVYDTEAERYMQGDTDETVAQVLGVMPGWVAQLRDEFFGPDGGNENIDALTEEIAGLRDDLDRHIKQAKAAAEAMQTAQDRLSAMMADLDRIKKAVGPRVLKQAGVK